jgi:hypothetical protein
MIERGIMSFKVMNDLNPWQSDFHYLCSWILSSCLLKRYFKETHLYCDTKTKKVLIDELDLPFDYVNTELDSFTFDSYLWALGKAFAYTKQEKPFIHIDQDVFLWQALPKNLLNKPLIAQFGEKFSMYRKKDGYINYPIEEIDKLLNWKPDIWKKAIKRPIQIACNCGIFGGNYYECINEYANMMIEIAQHPKNQSTWKILKSKSGYSSKGILCLEQWLIGAYIIKNQTYLTYLHNTKEEINNHITPFNNEFTHMLSPMVKQYKENRKELANRTKTMFPEYYKKLVTICDYKGDK